MPPCTSHTMHTCMIQPMMKIPKPRLVPVAALVSSVESRKARLLMESWKRKNVKKTRPKELRKNRSNWWAHTHTHRWIFSIGCCR